MAAGGMEEEKQRRFSMEKVQGGRWEMGDILHSKTINTGSIRQARKGQRCPEYKGTLGPCPGSRGL
jgi:hypothetical protein